MAISTDRLMQWQTGLIAVAVAILVGGVPWAMNMSSSVAVIREQVRVTAEGTSAGAQDIRSLERRVTSIEAEISAAKQRMKQ